MRKSLLQVLRGIRCSSVFADEIIILCVRCYFDFKLSYRDLVRMMADRGIALSHTTIMRWVLHYARMVKILEQPENQKSAMMDSSHERQSVGSSTRIRNWPGEPGVAPPERVPGCGCRIRSDAHWLRSASDSDAKL